jgi:DNA-binding transcriptional LysR family regulator
MIGDISDNGQRSMDRIAAMNAFVRVVEAGSFAKAADSLDLPRPTLTRLIQALEDELRVRLLQRTTRALTVTAEGAIYYERVLRLLADLDDIESTTKQSLVKPSGRIRVDAAPGLGIFVVVPALPDFYIAYPDIDVDLRIGYRHADLIAENVDCAIRAGDVTDESLVAKRIGEFRFITCASPHYLRRYGTPKVPGDLEKNHNTLGLIYGDAPKPQAFAFAKGRDRSEMSPRHRLIVNDTNAYVVAGVAGLGIIRAPNYAVKSALRAGELVAVLEDWQTSAVPVHVVFAPNRFLSAKVRVFIDWITSLVDWDVVLERQRA